MNRRGFFKSGPLVAAITGFGARTASHFVPAHNNESRSKRIVLYCGRTDSARTRAEFALVSASGTTCPMLFKIN